VEPTNWKENGKRAAGHGNLPEKIIRSSDTQRLYSEFVLPPSNLWREMEREWAILVYIYIYLYIYIRSLDTRRFY